MCFYLVFNIVFTCYRHLITKNKKAQPHNLDRASVVAIITTVQTEEAEEAIESLTPVGTQTPERARTLTGSQTGDVRPQTEELRVLISTEASGLGVRREQHPTSQEQEECVVRSRSASFLFDSPHVDDRDRPNVQDRDKPSVQDRDKPSAQDRDKSSIEERDKPDVQEDREKIEAGNERGKNDVENVLNNGNGENYRNRFSIGSFFTKLNSDRACSCPDLLSEKRTLVGLVRAEVTDKAPQEKMLERFPYLRLVRPLGAEHYAEIEADLDCDHELRRTTYMEKSKVHRSNHAFPQFISSRIL
ncbi:hypothetical protein OESDEN_00262 [Oesophagostomum dentatum]|uniref:Uncharacterized protein n=1 Tax=Oesophagostomum dentatum TaxID=61180 RepID=A0A0B1TQE8_OESDE|nr:hypothetical protein OESDEN_00262 [Oesophagostomum dentatum]